MNHSKVMGYKPTIECETLRQRIDNAIDLSEANLELQDYRNEGWQVAHIFKYVLESRGKRYPTIIREIELERMTPDISEHITMIERELTR